MDKANGRECYEVHGIRHTRLPWQLRAAGAAVGVVMLYWLMLCWLIDYVLIPAVLWTVLLAMLGQVSA